MKALLALRSVGICVGQRQMCLNVRWVSFFFLVFMQQKFFYHSVVCFCLLTMNANGWGFAFGRVGGTKSCQHEANAGAGYKDSNLHVTQPDAKPVLAAVLIWSVFCIPKNNLSLVQDYVQQ